MAIAFRAVATAVNVTSCNKPTGVVSGDLLLAFVIVYENTTGTLTLPSGWTEIPGAEGLQVAGGTTLVRACYKIAGGSEPSSYTFTMTPSGYEEVVLVAYSGSFDAGVIDAASVNTGNDASPTALSVTTSAANTMLVAHFSGYNNAFTSGPAGMTLEATWDGVNVLYDAPQAASGASGDKVASKPSDSWVASLVAIKEAGGGTFNPTQTTTETGSGADANSGALASTQADTASGADSGTSARLATIAETGSGADATTSARLATVAESGNGADANTSVRLTTIAEAASGADATSGLLANTTVDTGSGADAVTVQRQMTTADTASGIDAASAAGAGSSAESGSGADTPSGLLAATIADTASGIDASSATGDGAATSSDSSAGADTTSTVVAALAADAATGADLPSGLLRISVADVAIAVDRASVPGSDIAIVGACALLRTQAKASAALAQHITPRAAITPAARVATLIQQTKPLALLAQHTKPSAALAQRSC